MAMKIEKILSCICVLVILMSVVPVSVFATGNSENTTEITSRSNETFFVENEGLLDVIFEGTVTEVATGLNDWICEAKVDKVISGDYIFEGETVHITLSLLPCGTWDDVEEGDKIKVYGQSFPTYCLDCPLQVSVCGRSSYYLKKISSECLSISVWTDKPKYKIGETVTIYYQTNTACTAKLTVTKPDGTQVVVGGPNEIPVCKRSKSATAGYPTGTRTVTFDAWTSDESKKATCYFDVVEEEKPDLIIQDISWNPYSPQKGDTVTFTVKVKNQGSGSAGSSTVKYYIDGSYVASDSVPSLSAGSTSTQTFTWTANICGNVQVKAVADATSKVSESNEGNNCRAETVNVACDEKPDLIIQDISWSPSNPDKGDTVTFTVKIKNQGSGSAGSSTVKYYIDGSYVGSDSVPKLSAGSTSTQTFTWTANKCGDVKVKAVADANKEVSETLGKNNERTETVNVACDEKPDLIVSSLNFNPNPANKDDDVIVSVTVKNQGTGDAGTHFESLGQPDSSILWVLWECTGLKASASKTFTHTLENVQQSDTYEVCADWGQVIQESNENNNCLTGSLEVKKSDEKPVPKITKVEYPTVCVNEDEYATISVTVKNNGGASSEGYISVSFPNDEDVYVVSGTGNGYNKVYPKGSEIWGKDGKIPSSKDPLVELFDTDWGKGQQETITMKVKPNSGSDEIVFYVRAALKNDADGSYKRDPTYSGDTDQQGWYAEKYSVDVCSSMADVRFKGTVTNILTFISATVYTIQIDEVISDPTDSLKEGDTAKVSLSFDSSAQVDSVEVGDKVEVQGIYTGSESGEHTIALEGSGSSLELAESNIIYVPDDYLKIQQAVDAASPGDAIEVHSGTYYENVNVNKQLTLRGVDTGDGMPIVDSGGSGCAITLSADEIILEGFKATTSHSFNDKAINVVSNNNIIKDNYAYDSDTGIYLSSSSYNTLSDNIATSNIWGIAVSWSSNHNILSGNIANANNYDGISVVRSSNNNILSGNTASYSKCGSGILLYESNYNTLRDNIANTNGNYGIWLSKPHGISCNNNILYHNNLVNNINYNAWDSNGNNQWDNGTDTGNHYSNYDESSEGCTDTDGNVICDSRYYIPGGSSVDRYPLVSWSAAPDGDDIKRLKTALGSLKDTSQNLIDQDTDQLVEMHKIYYTRDGNRMDLVETLFGHVGGLIVDPLSKSNLVNWALWELVGFWADDLQDDFSKSIYECLHFTYTDLKPTDHYLEEKINNGFVGKNGFKINGANGTNEVKARQDVRYNGLIQYLESQKSLPVDFPINEILNKIRATESDLQSSLSEETTVKWVNPKPKIAVFDRLGSISPSYKMVKELEPTEDVGEKIRYRGYLIALGVAGSKLAYGIVGPGAFILEVKLAAATGMGIVGVTHRAVHTTEFSIVNRMGLHCIYSTAYYPDEVAKIDTIFNDTLNYVNATVHDPTSWTYSGEIVDVYLPDILLDDPIEPCLGCDIDYRIGYVTVSNTGPQDAKVKIFVDIFSSNGRHISLAESEIEELNSGETKPIYFSFGAPDPAKIGECTQYSAKIWVSVGTTVLYERSERTIFSVGTQQTCSAAQSQTIETVQSGNIIEGQSLQQPHTTQSSTKTIEFDLDYGGSDLDLHIYDSYGHHVGVNYDTGEIENEIPDASYSGSNTNPEWITIENAGGKTYTTEVVAVQTTENESYSLLATETPELPALLDISPSNLTVSGLQGDSVEDTLIFSEYGGFNDLSGISITASDLSDGMGGVIPSSSLTFDMPSTEISAGSAMIVNLTINIPTDAVGGRAYSGIITAEDDGGAIDNARVNAKISTSQPSDCNPWDDDGLIEVSEIMDAITLWTNQEPPASGCDLLTVSDIMDLITMWTSQSK